jgi:hypothetical protein
MFDFGVGICIYFLAVQTIWFDFPVAHVAFTTLQKSQSTHYLYPFFLIFNIDFRILVPTPGFRTQDINSCKKLSESDKNLNNVHQDKVLIDLTIE